MKTNKKTYILCAVERGWKGMRQFALIMAEKGYHVDLILREKLSPELLKIISLRSGIQIIPCGKKIFPFRFAAKVIGRVLFHKVKWLVFNRHERLKKNERLCRLAAAESLILEEKGNRYHILSEGGEVAVEGYLNNTK